MVIFSALRIRILRTAASAGGEGVVRYNANVKKKENPHIQALHLANVPEDEEKDPKGKIGQRYCILVSQFW